MTHMQTHFCDRKTQILGMLIFLHKQSVSFDVKYQNDNLKFYTLLRASLFLLV